MKKFSLIFLLLIVFSIEEVNAQTVYKTPSGKKYHLVSCRMVENVSGKLSFDEAMALGLEACKICKPDHKNSLIAPNDNKPKGEKTTTQCNGITKAGNRCKHMTRIANG